jgi:hypothetical protein
MNNHFKYRNSNRQITHPNEAGKWAPFLRPTFYILHFIFYILHFAFIISLVTACTPDPPPTLNYKDRQLVDSLFRREVDSLKPILDSICEIRFDSSVQAAVDSIISERESEKEKYLERVKKEMEEE